MAPTLYKREDSGFKHWFGSQDLGIKYAIVICSLLALTIIVGLFKVLYVKQRTKKIVKEQAIAKSEAKEELHTLNIREEDEGDLFGVRALDRGFYGGVAQSRPGTPLSFNSPSIAKPNSAHVSSRPGSSHGNGPKTSSLTPASNLKITPPDAAFDTRLSAPPSPLSPLSPRESRSPSPTSLQAPGPAPKLALPILPSPGLTISSTGNSPLIQDKASSPVVTHPHASGIYSDRGSIGQIESPPSSSTRNYAPYSKPSIEHEQNPSIPRINLPDEGSGHEERAEWYTQVYEPNYQPESTSITGSNHLSIVITDTNNHDSTALNFRSSTPSFGGIYDSYYDDRLSVIPINEQSTVNYSNSGEEEATYRPYSVSIISDTFSDPQFRSNESTYSRTDDGIRI